MITSYKKLYWTDHVKLKMRQHGLSKNKILNVLHRPQRREVGFVEGTMALMQTNKVYGSYKLKKLPAFAKASARPAGEIWLMYKDTPEVRKIISAWRYPGISKLGEEIPIPSALRQELMAQL